ncbi:hypothetical protein [Lysinibacillus sp. NPDC093216]|uniref:hypothetical protein n=1 Tax=Lysinibacillus sp. NPDC093216 TaxID=3390576 RepID=UPI003D00ABF7
MTTTKLTVVPDSKPVVPDSHVTIIRVDSTKHYPEYVCDYLRRGFGAFQIQRLYTLSTVLIEIQPSDVDKIVFPKVPPVKQQIEESRKLRAKESEMEELIKKHKKGYKNRLIIFIR